MIINGTRRLCRVGLAAVLVTALCALAFVDLPPDLTESSEPDTPPTLDGEEASGTRSIVAYSWARRLALDYRASVDCFPNETILWSDLIPKNSRAEKKWVDSTNGRLYLFSAHYDDRITGYPSVRVIGVRRGFLNARIYCTVWYEEEEEDGFVRSKSMEALVTDIWLEEWGGLPESYTGVLITCPLERPLVRRVRTTVGSSPCSTRYHPSLKVSNSGSKRIDTNERVEKKFTLCVKGLDFDEDISSKLVSFVELHRILGANYFFFYVFNVHENVTKVLRFYERSKLASSYDFTLPGELPNERFARRRLLEKEPWTKRRMELIPYNHCFYESLGTTAEYVVPLDIDETIIPSRGRTWSELIEEEKNITGESFKNYASYAVRNAYFFPKFRKNEDKREEKIRRANETRKNYRKKKNRGGGGGEKEWSRIEYLATARTRSISPEGDSVKSFVSIERTLTVHNHYALTALNPSTSRAHHFDPDRVIKHHHRICDDRHLDCDLLTSDLVEDKTVLRYAEELARRTNSILVNATIHRTTKNSAFLV